MKTFLNILIIVLVLMVWSDIEANCLLEVADYWSSIVTSIILVSVIIARIHVKKVVEFLTTAS